MVISSKKKASEMSQADRYREQLEEIQELNRLFLAYLKKRVESGDDKHDLSARVRATLLAAMMSGVRAWRCRRAATRWTPSSSS